MEFEDKIKCYGELYYYVPLSTPERPIETLYANLPQAQQYWRRQIDYPDFFFDYDPHLPEKKICRINASKTNYVSGKLVTLSVEDTKELDRLLLREVTRMKNGVYMMNNGIKVYLPGAYYGVLQWCKMIGVEANGGYGQHRRYQREFSCQRQKVIDDERLKSYYLEKIKKCGISQLIALFWVIESITNRQFSAAVMSKNHDTAKSANFKYYIYGLKNLPKILTPFIEQKGWSSAIQRIQIKCSDADLSLENVVVAAASVSDGLDGLPPLKRVSLSEMPKMAEAEAILAKSKEQLQIQKTKIGIIEIESYPPEDDTKSFKFCRNLYYDSMKLDADGYPINGMLPLYIGLLEATQGTHDIYGDPDKFSALAMEQVERAKCDTPAKLQARKRQYHLTVKESWEIGGGGSVYNNLALAEQQATLEDMYKNSELNYTLGNLEWTEGRPSIVRFVPTTLQEMKEGKYGKWELYKTGAALERFLKEQTNLCFKMPRKKKIINKELVELLQPPDDVIHCGGIDPVDYSYVSEMGTTQSKNASIVRDITGNMVSLYHFRGEDPDEALDDFCKEMIFFGTYTIVEGNRKNAVTTLEKLGMYFFMLVRHPNGEIAPYSQSITIKHVSSGKDLKAKYIELITKHIKNNIEFFQSLKAIEQHKEFEPDDTQKYDVSVSDGLSFVAVETMQTWMLSNKNKIDLYAHLGSVMARVM